MNSDWNGVWDEVDTFSGEIREFGANPTVSVEGLRQDLGDWTGAHLTGLPVWDDTVKYEETPRENRR